LTLKARKSPFFFRLSVPLAANHLKGSFIFSLGFSPTPLPPLDDEPFWPLFISSQSCVRDSFLPSRPLNTSCGSRSLVLPYTLKFPLRCPPPFRPNFLFYSPHDQRVDPVASTSFGSCPCALGLGLGWGGGVCELFASVTGKTNLTFCVPLSLPAALTS